MDQTVDGQDAIDEAKRGSDRIYTDNRCQEGNYGLPRLLRGARGEDKAFAEGKGPDPATICTSGCGAVGEDAEPINDAFQ